MLKIVRAMLKNLCLVLMTCGILCLNTLHAAESPQIETPQKDEAEFFASVNETGGYITQALHKEFWDVMKSKYDDEQRQKIVEDIQNSLDILREFQLRTWESAKESYYAKKKEKVKDYEELKAKLLQLHSQYFSPQVIIENSDKIITSSADRAPVDLGAGKFYITPELIEENMIGIKGSYERLKILATPEWKEEYKEYTLPKINVSLLSLYAPDEYHEIISHADEKIDIHIVQLCTNLNSVYEIGSVDYQKGDKKFVDFSPEEKKFISKNSSKSNLQVTE